MTIGLGLLQDEYALTGEFQIFNGWAQRVQAASLPVRLFSPVGRQLRARTLFTERKEGVMQLRRGFAVEPGERVLVCEDVVTTGGSVKEVIAIVKQHGGKVAGAAYIVDRSGGKVQFAMEPGAVQYSLLRMDLIAHPPEKCPWCAQGIPVLKPGSRGNTEGIL